MNLSDRIMLAKLFRFIVKILLKLFWETQIRGSKQWEEMQLEWAELDQEMKDIWEGELR